MKYGFPLFTKERSNIYLGNHKELIISDIWSFWDYIIKKHKKDKHFLQSCLEQAKFFYITADNSPIKSKPLLYYYSFLNLAKIILNLENNYGPSKKYMHGIKEINNGNFSKSEVKIKISNFNNDVVNIASELMKVFKNNISYQTFKINLKKMLIHCVGIHRSYCELYNQKEVFFKLDKPTLYKDGKKLIFHSKLKKTLTKDELNDLKKINYTIEKDKNDDYFLKVEQYIQNYNVSRKDYYNLSTKIRILGVWYLIGKDGYTLYISKCQNDRYNIESIIYNMMFYLGSITRYHPYLFDEIFNDKEQWLMSEFLKTQPKQFLYLATANILGQNVLKAYVNF